MGYHNQPQHSLLVLKTQEIIHWSQIRPSLLFSWGCWWGQTEAWGQPQVWSVWESSFQEERVTQKETSKSKWNKAQLLHDTVLEGEFSHKTGLLQQNWALLSKPIFPWHFCPIRAGISPWAGAVPWQQMGTAEPRRSCVWASSVCWGQDPQLTVKHWDSESPCDGAQTAPSHEPLQHSGTAVTPIKSHRGTTEEGSPARSFGTHR